MVMAETHALLKHKQRKTNKKIKNKQMTFIIFRKKMINNLCSLIMTFEKANAVNVI